MEILWCEGVQKTFGSPENPVRALQNVSFSAERGEFTAIVGPSGSGKSTLLHIIGAVESLTEGRVLVEGEDVGRMNPTRAALYRRRTVGLVYQFFNLVPTLTVRKNILLPVLLDKKQPDEGFFQKITDALGITGKLDALPGQLSGGQQQRVAIARSLLYRPALLLCDEPTGNLDGKNTREIIDLLAQCNRTFRQTVLLVTHDESVAARAGRILTMEDGRLTGDRKTGNA